MVDHEPLSIKQLQQVQEDVAELTDRAEKSQNSCWPLIARKTPALCAPKKYALQFNAFNGHWNVNRKS
jgi:hypothetical protein